MPALAAAALAAARHVLIRCETRADPVSDSAGDAGMSRGETYDAP